MLIVSWYFLAQDFYIERFELLDPFYRTISHGGTGHLISNTISIVISCMAIVYFVSYKGLLLVTTASAAASYHYYSIRPGMVGFSVVTSGLMGCAVTMFFLNVLVLSTKNRVRGENGRYVELASKSVNLRSYGVKILFTAQIICFIYVFVPRITDLLMFSGIVPKNYTGVPTIVLHSRDYYRSDYAIEAHSIGFITGLFVTMLLVIWITSLGKKVYEERLFNYFNTLDFDLN